MTFPMFLKYFFAMFMTAAVSCFLVSLILLGAITGYDFILTQGDTLIKGSVLAGFTFGMFPLQDYLNDREIGEVKDET